MSLRDVYNQLPEPYRTEMLAKIKFHWPSNARPEQLIPVHNGIYAIFADRGWGKTRTGAEWVRELAKVPNTRMILSGPTTSYIRSVMIEGPSGILYTTPPAEVPSLHYASRKITWANGSMAFLCAANEGDRIRGIQANYAWAEETGSWPEGSEFEAWANLRMATRLGSDPQLLVTSSASARNDIHSFLEEAVANGAPDVILKNYSTTPMSPISSGWIL